MITKERLGQISLSCNTKNPSLMSKTILFSQVISKLDRTIFNRQAENKQTNKRPNDFGRWSHLVSMLFCQFFKSTSVRNISMSGRIKKDSKTIIGAVFFRKIKSQDTISV